MKMCLPKLQTRRPWGSGIFKSWLEQSKRSLNITQRSLNPHAPTLCSNAPSGRPAVAPAGGRARATWSWP